MNHDNNLRIVMFNLSYIQICKVQVTWTSIYF